jgi:flagellar assembly protein FliH
MFSNSVDFEAIFTLPVMALEYRDLAGSLSLSATAKPASESSVEEEAPRRRADVEFTQEEFAARLHRERTEATALVEQRLRQEYELKLQAEKASIAAAIASFEVERIEYYARVEAEIVQLTLAIAAKILHREAQVDPMLLAALVRMSVEHMREGSSVTVRVNPSGANLWKEFFSGNTQVRKIQVVEDADLSELDCLIETELGTANFGLDTQLKEVEQGFFDLLALRPVAR